MITVAHYLILTAILFSLGLVGMLINRRNVILLLICVELMLLAVNTNFIVFSHFHKDITGQLFVFFILNRCSGRSGYWIGHCHAVVSKSPDY